VKKIGGKSIRGWIGIRKNDDEDESTSLDL
jgi:hypothetical protein